MTGGKAPGLNLTELGNFLPAAVGGLRAPGGEAAPRRGRRKGRRTPGDADLGALVAHAGQGVYQHLGVRMDGVIEDVLGGTQLNDAAEYMMAMRWVI